jgi:tRNA threonylcarbamoyladenosine biosynthesis protein TsaB
MFVLALDTTTSGGSVALVNENGVIDERASDAGRSHAERLPGELTALVRAASLRLGDIDVFAVARGPGSFTGLRIGIATIQGLALAAARPVVAVSAFEASAQTVEGARPGDLIAAWIDARRRHVYASLFQVRPGAAFSPDRLAVEAPPAVGDPGEVLAGWRERLRDEPITFVGDGACLYADTIRHALPAAAIVAAAPLLAGAIGRLAVTAAGRGETIHPAAIQPLYVRRPDAEITRDQRGVIPKTPGARA